jgi:hypothetical protein
VESAKSVEHERRDVALADLPVRGVGQVDTDRGRDGIGVDEREPAERDDAEEQLRGFTRRRRIEPELGGDRGERLLPGREPWRHHAGAAPARQRLPLDEAHEVRVTCEEIEVIANGAGENVPRRAVAGQRALAARPDGAADLTEGALENRGVQLGLGAEEIAGGRAGGETPARAPTSARLVAS